MSNPDIESKPPLPVSKIEPNNDDLVLRANGHKSEMCRQFSWLSGLGLGFSITNSWVGYLSSFGRNMAYGRPRLVITGLVLAFIVQSVIAIGLVEIASAFPSSGGQYHFCFLLAPQKTKRSSGYIVGWMSVVAWWVTTSSGISLVATTLAGLIHFFNPAFVATQWQIYLFSVAAAVVTIIPVFIASKKVAFVCQITLLMSVIGMVLTPFVPVGMHEHVQPASSLGSSSASPGKIGTGWGEGVSWMLGICNAMYAFGGTHAARHISEEMQDPGRRVPQIVMGTLAMGLAATLPLFVALLLFANDPEKIVHSSLPSAELIYQATGSRPATLFLITWLVIIYISCIPSQWVASGRIAWAFARDNGVPFSSYFSTISPTLGFPVRTTTAAFIFVLLYGLLYLASTTAFNSIITSAVLVQNITYAVPQGILLMNRLSLLFCQVSKRRKEGKGERDEGEVLPPRYLDLGSVIGPLCNAFSTLWIIVLGVFVCFPPELPVSVGSMNYTPVVAAGNIHGCCSVLGC